MLSRRRTVEWIVTGLLGGLLLAGGFTAAVFQQPLLAAAGLTRDGAPDTLDPELLAAATTPAPTAPAVDGTGLVGAAEPAVPGAPVTRAQLEARLDALDTSLLVPAEGGATTIAYEVVDVTTGEIVASRGAATPLIPASNTKTLTALAVMNAFEGTETFATTVVEPSPGTIVLVGGGDPLLLSVPAAAGAYPQPASTQELARAVAEKLRAAGTTTVTLGYNADHFAEPGWNDTWPATYRDQVTQLSALWVDEGKLPAGGRSRTPALDAARTFAEQLTAEGIAVAGAPAPAAAEGTELARVESLPVHVLVEQAMNRSNNSFTEILGLQLARQVGQPSTFAGAVAAIEGQLTGLGVWDEGTVLHDSSGLSRSNRITTHMLARAILLLDSEPRLSVILDGLPTAGVAGTLSERFFDDTSAPARGVARAKTGTLSLVSTLAGTTVTADGRLMAFAFMINGAPNGWAAKLWADQATGVVAGCGC